MKFGSFRAVIGLKKCHYRVRRLKWLSSYLKHYRNRNRIVKFDSSRASMKKSLRMFTIFNWLQVSALYQSSTRVHLCAVLNMSRCTEMTKNRKLFHCTPCLLIWSQFKYIAQSLQSLFNMSSSVRYQVFIGWCKHSFGTPWGITPP